MRISDWSSDVCSSDLVVVAEGALGAVGAPHRDALGVGFGDGALDSAVAFDPGSGLHLHGGAHCPGVVLRGAQRALDARRAQLARVAPRDGFVLVARSGCATGELACGLAGGAAFAVEGDPTTPAGQPPRTP